MSSTILPSNNTEPARTAGAFRSDLFFHVPLFINNLKRSKVLMIVSGILMFISNPFITIVASISNSSVMDNRGDLESLLTVTIFATIYTALTVNLYVNSYAHQRKSAIFYTSLPIKHRALYITNAVTALAVCLIPLIATYIIVLLQWGGSPYWDVVFDYFLKTLLLCVATSATVTLAAKIAGNTLSSLLVLVYGTGIGAAVLGVMTIFVELTYRFTNPFYIITEGIYAKSSPIVYYTYRLINDKMTAVDFVCMFLLIAAFYVIGALLGKQNRAEDASKSFYKPVFEELFRYSILILSVIIAGTLFFFIEGQNSGNVVSYIIGGLFSVFVMHLVLNIVIYRNLRDIFKGMGKAAVVTSLTMIILGLFIADIFGIDKYMPDINNVESVAVEDHLIVNHNAYVEKFDFSAGHEVYDYEKSSELSDKYRKNITNKDTIQKIFDLANFYMKNDRKIFLVREEYYADRTDFRTPLRGMVKFNTKNGSPVYKQLNGNYNIAFSSDPKQETTENYFDDLNKLTEALVTDPDYIDTMLYPLTEPELIDRIKFNASASVFIDVHEYKIEYTNGVDKQNVYSGSLDLTKEDLTALIAALKTDASSTIEYDGSRISSSLEIKIENSGYTERHSFNINIEGANTAFSKFISERNERMNLTLYDEYPIEAPIYADSF
ncbi:hypothetical protein FACS1894105_09570 [Clostridia bacterium]|nr:hypothetical protein FACS1894105_09570 [Clostridia bacterium]